MNQGSNDRALVSCHKQAQQWFIILRDYPEDPTLILHFKEWLEQDERNESCYLEVCMLWQEMGDASVIQQQERPEHCESELLENSAASNIYRSSLTNKRPLVTALSITMLLILVVIMLPLHIMYSPDYYTLVGETQRIELVDGSVLHLNSQSAVNINYSNSARAIELLYGEAFFEVAHNTSRPFEVHSQNITATALGTAFNVRQLNQDTETTLTEGRLSISLESDDSDSTDNIIITKGQRVTTHAGRLTLSEGHNLYMPDWKRNLMRLDNLPLTDVITLLNRQYNTRFVLLNRNLSSKKMNGVIPLNNLPVTLKLLSNSLNLRTTSLFDQVILLR